MSRNDDYYRLVQIEVTEDELKALWKLTAAHKKLGLLADEIERAICRNFPPRRSRS